jgi:hypothetical protein
MLKQGINKNWPLLILFVSSSKEAIPRSIASLGKFLAPRSAGESEVSTRKKQDRLRTFLMIAKSGQILVEML